MRYDVINLQDKDQPANSLRSFGPRFFVGYHVY